MSMTEQGLSMFIRAKDRKPKSPLERIQWGITMAKRRLADPDIRSDVRATAEAELKHLKKKLKEIK